MSISEITLNELNAEEFIAKQVTALGSAVGEEIAINALSGGVDSSVVTLLGHRAFGDRLKTYFIDNGLMREGEPQQIVEWFEKLGVKVEIVDAREKFFAGLEGVTDPEEKREKGITQVFYKDVFAELVRQSGAKVLLQGTNYTDVEETAAGVKRQHNVFEQIGIDPKEAFGYQVVEPILQLRKPAVRVVARALGLPAEISERPPFPGPAVTGIRDGGRDFGQQIEVRCWESTDAVTATPTELPFATLRRIADRIVEEVPGVVSVTYNVTAKPPSCIEAV